MNIGLKDIEKRIEIKKDIYLLIKSGQLKQAEDQLLEIISETTDDPDFEFALKMVKFWLNRIDLFEFDENKINGEKLYKEWQNFILFCREEGIDNRKAFFALKTHIFQQIVDMLIEFYKLTPLPDKEILILLGEAFFELGINDRAIETLEYALSVLENNSDVRIYRLLGDLYFNSEQIDLAMVMYNEAFYKYPQDIDLDLVEFINIKKIYEMILEDGIDKSYAIEWVPFYGYIYNSLTSRRNLEYQEYLELKEKIIEYEKSINIDKRVVHIIIPRLLNYYLWATDYYLFQIKIEKPIDKIRQRIITIIQQSNLSEKVIKKLSDRTEIIYMQLLNYFEENRNKN